MKIFLGADHRGFELKEKIKKYLVGKGHAVEDKGAPIFDPGDDYPDFAYPVAIAVSKNPNETRGILLCGSGMGMDVVANKVRGVRATVAYSESSAVHAREHDDINVITLAADVISPEEAEKIIDAFLTTPLSTEERHARRLKKIEAIESEHFQ